MYGGGKDAMNAGDDGDSRSYSALIAWAGEEAGGMHRGPY